VPVAIDRRGGVLRRVLRSMTRRRATAASGQRGAPNRTRFPNGSVTTNSTKPAGDELLVIAEPNLQDMLTATFTTGEADA
jgi:hypothetical protein